MGLSRHGIEASEGGRVISPTRFHLARARAFAGLPPSTLDAIERCSSLDRFEAGEEIAHAGDVVSRFFVVRDGLVSIQSSIRGREPLILASYGEGDAFGWASFVKPFEWIFDAVAVEPTRVISLDAECLRRNMDADHELGFQLLSRFADHALSELALDRLGHLVNYRNGG